MRLGIDSFAGIWNRREKRLGIVSFPGHWAASDPARRGPRPGKGPRWADAGHAAPQLRERLGERPHPRRAVRT